MSATLRGLIIVTASLLLGAATNAGPVHIALLSETSVITDAIMLSRLLPDGSSRALKLWAEKVPLGASPSIGYERRLGRLEIAQAIRAAASSRVEFAIPEMVVVRRQGKTISKEEIYEILRRELLARGNPAATGIRAEDVELQSGWEIPLGAKEARLKQLAVDPLLGQMRFRLGWAGNSSAPDLYGWLRWTPSESKMKPSATGDARDEVTVKPLVAANRPALLFLHSQNSETLVHVKALEPGRMGDLIRVRIPANGHTLTARVVGRDRLDLSF